MFCTRCGAALPEGSAFCPKCGALVTPTGAQTSPAAGSVAAAPAAAAPSYAAPAAGSGAAPAWAPAAPAGPAPPFASTPPVVDASSVFYAGFWRRFVAMIIDSLILYIVTFPISLLFHVPILAWAHSDDVSPEDVVAAIGSLMMVALVSAVLHWLYYALMESSPRQATLGKMALNVRVTDLQWRRLSFGRATGRYFAKILSGLILLIGYIMAAFTSRKQALHDMIAGTLVIRGGEGG
ncbi:MAG TPA: RDD family protein [Candidatus Saccharimonadaceae bacterium]|nr:RDD family protein [Candidatus Saccharimonadaceae bacterium]